MRKIMCSALALVMLLSVTACGKEDSNDNKKASAPLKEITTEVIEKSDIKFPEMVEVSEDNFQFRYGIEADDYTEYSVYWAGSGGDADEVCIIKAASGKLDDVKNSVKSRLDSQKEVFKDYVPEEYDQLCESEIKTKSGYVYWVCSDDNKKAEEKILSYFE